MKCPRCQHENPAGVKFCGECGAGLESVCPACGASNPPGNKFCGQCGVSLAQVGTAPKFVSPQSYTPKHLAEKILTSKSALEGERKQVTVLFADMKGSMELLADRDPEEARKILDPVLEQMMEAVHRYEGTVNQVMGDGIMALFGAPLAHEDHAMRACYAALRMHGTVGRYAEELRRTQGLNLQIRAGVNSGEVVVRSIGNDLHMDYTAVGQTTHLASRMEQLASPGTTLITGETLRLAEGYFKVKPLGPVPVKGLTEPIEVYEVTGAGPARTRLQAAVARGLTRFVGRDAEVEALRQALEKARGGHGQVVAIVGEPGVGKSRLFYEFIHSHRTHAWLVLESGSVSYGKATPYLPVIDLLKAYFKIQDRDDHREIREKVTGKLLTLDEALKPSLPGFLNLLDLPVEDSQWQNLDPPQRRQRTLEAVKCLLLRESQLQPLVLVFEDLHWIDSESQAALDSLIESLPTARILLLVNYRPEYQHSWGSKTFYMQLRIDPLPPESANELLQALLGDDAGLQPLKQILIARTEGNPFFLEESVHTLVETKALVGERGAYRLAKPIESIQVPATVQAVLAARIDRLPPEEKHLLQSASVIGKDVPFLLLEAIVEEADERLRQRLAHLQAAEFLYETSLFPDLEYTFKHALTHEVGYSSLLQERRHALHARIIEAIEKIYPDRLTEQIERLAHHAFRGEMWEKATSYLHQAGRKAAERSAHQEAIAYFEQALAALGHLPESRQTLEQAIDIRVDFGPVLMATKGFAASEVETSYNSARELCEKIGETRQLFPVLWGLWLANNIKGRHHTAQELGKRLIALAEQKQDVSLLLQAHHALWTTLFTVGELAAAKDHLQQGLPLYDPQQHRSHAFLYGGHDTGVCCRGFYARTLWMLGYPDQAVKNVKDAVRLAQELSHPFSIGVALASAAEVYYQRGEWEGVADHGRLTVSLATEQGFSAFVAYGQVLLGRSMVEEGRDEEGIAQLDSALAALRATRGTGGYRGALLLSMFAEACGKKGQIEKGLQAVAEALGMPEKNAYEAELHRIKGELLLRQVVPNEEQAEACFQQAIEVARSQEAKSLELRAVMSLSRLWQRQGKQKEAKKLLTEIYGWFTEGFDTADLKQAKALLEELA